jgi:hypothetical protein
LKKSFAGIWDPFFVDRISLVERNTYLQSRPRNQKQTAVPLATNKEERKQLDIALSRFNRKFVVPSMAHSPDNGKTSSPFCLGCIVSRPGRLVRAMVVGNLGNKNDAKTVLHTH